MCLASYACVFHSGTGLVGILKMVSTDPESLVRRYGLIPLLGNHPTVRLKFELGRARESRFGPQAWVHQGRFISTESMP